MNVTTEGKLASTFQRCRSEKRAALMPFLTCGYPSMGEFNDIAKGVIAAGADIVEVGFPHSDPLADGPVIQKASHHSLQCGFRVSEGLNKLSELSSLDVPSVVMCYSNVLLNYGAERFVKQAAEANVSGLIIPDMIIEESDTLRSLSEANGLAFVNLTTPTTVSERALTIIRATSGFLYVVSVTGTTGARSQLDPNLRETVQFLKSATDLPVCVGFGVSTPEMARELGSYSDGVIVGSKLLSLLDPQRPGSEQFTAFAFVRELRAAVEGSHG